MSDANSRDGHETTLLGLQREFLLAGTGNIRMKLRGLDQTNLEERHTDFELDCGVSLGDIRTGRNHVRKNCPLHQISPNDLRTAARPISSPVNFDASYSCIDETFTALLCRLHSIAPVAAIVIPSVIRTSSTLRRTLVKL
jgi:hypothetical protein